MSTFSGLNIARLGMQAQQKAMEVTGHNVANANTPGYSRQIAHMATTVPIPYDGKGMLGTGVKVDEISRVRDNFLDMQIRKEKQLSGQWEARSQTLAQIEQIFMEPSETGFHTVLGNFFEGWQDLSLNPESSAARSALVENSNTLVNSIKHVNDQLKTVRSNIDDKISLTVVSVNSLAEQIKDLNTQIVRLVSLGETPADLLDRRDLLIDELAGMVEFSALETNNGAINISIGGRALVSGGNAYKLALEHSQGVVDGWPAAPKIIWERDGLDVKTGSGEIGGLLEIRDKNLKEYMEGFESLAWGVINEVNALHTQGMDLYGHQGEGFFSGEHLETLVVSDTIKGDLGKIAASLPPANWDDDNPSPNAGDSGNALRIAQLRNAAIVVDTSASPKNRLRLAVENEKGVSSFEDYYRGNIAGLGVDAQESNRMVENQHALLDMMYKRRDSISGVSLDEELSNLIQFQMAFQASARMVTTLDEIFDTIINRMLR